MFTFSVVKGQKYDLTIAPKDADGNPASLTGDPTVKAADPSEFALGPVTINTDEAGNVSYTVQATALKTGTSAILIHAVGATELNAEADGTVTNPLATALLLSGKVAS